MSGSTTNNTIIGSGSDNITLNLSEDQAVGTDAQFTVNVDGQQIGGVQTVTASHSAGQEQSFTFAGNYAPGPHNVTVTFENNFIYPGVAGDRNLYVDGLSYDGQTISNSTTPIYESPFFPPNSNEGNVYGNAIYTVNDTTAVPDNAPSTPTTTPGAVSVGSGADTLVLNMAENPYLGDAQFTVSVDGQQIGGTQTTTADVAQGQQQEFDVHGNFGSGNHTVSVAFVNDKIGDFYPGTQLAVDTTDRNLYIMSMSLDGGAPATGTPWELASNGSNSWSVTAGSNPAAGDTIPASGSGSGMSFIASAPTPTTASGGSTTSGLPAVASSLSATDTTPAVASPTTQDFGVPTTTASTVPDSTGSSGGSNHSWWISHQSANDQAPAWHQHS